MLRAGDLAQCERVVSARLTQLPRSSFHIILDLPITIDPKSVGAGFDEFFQKVGESFKGGAAYTEMNCFDINTDHWFCRPFACERYDGHDDYDWLSDRQGDTEDGIAIEGLASLQEVYAVQVQVSGLGGSPPPPFIILHSAFPPRHFFWSRQSRTTLASTLVV
jgi:hypothetical protein